MKQFRYVLAVVALAGAATSARATTVDWSLIEELVASADMVAVVECTTAGGMAARFTVVEPLKGPKAGTVVTIGWPANAWGDQFPVALCGERFLVTGYKSPPNNLVAAAVRGPVPLWWRNVPVDYRLPLMEGRYLLPRDPDKDEFTRTLLKTARELAAMTPAEQEVAVLRALIDANVVRRQGRFEKPLPPDRQEAVRKRFAGLGTAAELVGELARLAREDPKEWEFPTVRVLARGGGANALAALKKLPEADRPWDADRFKYVVSAIEVRVTPPKPGARPDPVEAPPTADALAAWRKALADRESPEWGGAFTGLTRHNPAVVAEFLMKWEVPVPENEFQRTRTRDMGYGLGSFFAWRCGKDRGKHLAALLEAKDPWVRVAAAVHLCFEDEAKGVAALKKLTALDGDPGGWAALTLARRGHADAVPRALRLFPDRWTDEAEAQNFSTPRHNFQSQLLVLLSNAANAGKVPQFQLPERGLPTRVQLEAWWDRHKAALVLRDPWLELLARQKVD
jgi:hypothetical protein